MIPGEYFENKGFYMKCIEKYLSVESLLTQCHMVFWTPEHSTPDSIYSIVFWPSYPWHIEPPSYLLIRNKGAQNTMGVKFTRHGEEGGGIFNKGVQYTMGFKIPWQRECISFTVIYHGTSRTVMCTHLFQDKKIHNTICFYFKFASVNVILLYVWDNCYI